MRALRKCFCIVAFCKLAKDLPINCKGVFFFLLEGSFSMIIKLSVIDRFQIENRAIKTKVFTTDSQSKG